MSRELNDRQRKFAENINRGMSATDAAIKAGYDAKWAGTHTTALLKNANVKAYLDELRAASRTQAVADGTEIRTYLTKVMRDEVKDIATGGKDLEYIRTPMPAGERTKAAQELAKLDGHYAPTRVDLKVAEYSRDWLKQALAVIGRHVPPDTLRRIAAELPRFDP